MQGNTVKVTIWETTHTHTHSACNLRTLVLDKKGTNPNSQLASQVGVLYKTFKMSGQMAKSNNIVVKHTHNVQLNEGHYMKNQWQICLKKLGLFCNAGVF